MRKLIGGVLSVALFSHVVNGQLLTDKVMPPSSNAAAIIKYCDHPVGTKAGIPKIRIPFRTLAGDGVFVPISLNYHSLGVRVEEEATWTGLGWYLNAGGMITRIVRGKNDFGLVEEELNPTAKVIHLKTSSRALTIVMKMKHRSSIQKYVMEKSILIRIYSFLTSWELEGNSY